MASVSKPLLGRRSVEPERVGNSSGILVDRHHPESGIKRKVAETPRRKKAKRG